MRHASPEFRLYLLGSFHIERDRRTIGLPTRKIESLLCYLVLHPQQLTREKLAAQFWGDSTDAQARHSLSVALDILRKKVGSDLFLANRESVQLNPDLVIWLDTREIERLRDSELDMESLRLSISFYRGDLLLDFYDDWITPERERLRMLYMNALLRLSQDHRSRSEYNAAIEIAQKVLACDRANERAHQHLMFCYLASGRRDAALKQFEVCQDAMREELAVEPAPETIALYHWIKQTPSEVRSLEARITNLPIPVSSFIGRQRETAQVKELLSQARLVTLSGAGGCGKTRLAIQMATDLIDAFKDGVWWVEFAALMDESLVSQRVANALGVQENPGESLTQTLANWLRSRHLLLIFDNCEHLIAACARLAAELLNASATLKVLTTSREALGITGEIVWRVASLSVPESFALNELLLSFESIRLFVERAGASQPGFALSEQNAASIAQICQRLGGIPLAIELAAARVKTLSPQQIAARLDDRFNLLTRASRTALPRQQTLRAAIDWSYDLLSKQEIILFRRLSVFAGGWTLQAAEAVVAPDAIFSYSTLDLITRLVDKSLVIAEERDGAARYRMLETIQEYAREKLEAADESAPSCDRHLDFFMSLAQQAESKLFGPSGKEWLDRLETEHDNLRAALEWSVVRLDKQVTLDRDSVEVSLTFAAALWWFWELRGHFGEGRAYLSVILNVKGAEKSSARARALHAAGRLAYCQGDLNLALELLEQSHAMARVTGDQWTQMVSLHDLGNVLEDRGELALAHSAHEESMSMARELGDDWGIAWAFMGLGHVATRDAYYAAARSFYEASLQIRRRTGDKWGIARSLNELGIVARLEGNYADAQNFNEESLTIHRELGHKSFFVANAVFNLGSIAYLQGDYERATALFVESLTLVREQGMKNEATWSLIGSAQVAAAVGQFESAMRLFGAVESLNEAMGFGVTTSDQAQYAPSIADLRAQLDEATFNKAWSEGRAMSFEQAIEYALETLKSKG